MVTPYDASPKTCANMTTSHVDQSDVAPEKGQPDEYLDRVDTVDIDNYHGISLKIILVYLALCLQYFVQLYNVVGSGAFSRNIAAAIGGESETVWLSQIIVITTVVLGPPASQAADFFGRRWFLISAGAFGFAGSLIVAKANSIGQAIGGQVVSSILYIAQPILIAVVSEILPRKFRPIAQAGLNSAGALGAIVGLLAGSELTTSLFGWRNYFYISAALMGASAIIIAVLYNPPQRALQKSLSLQQKLTRLDWVAYILLATSLSLFVMGLSWAYNPYPWSDPHVIAPLVTGTGLFIALVVHQIWWKRDGLIHHDLFKKDRNFAITLGCFFVDGLIFWAANNYFAFEIAVLYETRPMMVVLHFTIAFFTAIAASASVVLITAFTKAVREPIVAAFIMFTVFFALMSSAGLSSTSGVWAYPIFLGIGLGWSLTYLTTVAQLSTPPHLIAITSGILLAIRAFGGAIGLAIFSAIFNSKINSSLGASIAAAVLPLGFPPQELEGFIGALAGNNQAALMQLPGVTPQIIGAGVNALKSAYLASFKNVWIAAAVFAGATVIASCFILNPKADLNNHVDAPLEE